MVLISFLISFNAFTWKRVFAQYSIVVIWAGRLSGRQSCVLLNSGQPKALRLSVHTVGWRQLLKFLETADLSQETITQLLTHQARTKENNACQIVPFLIHVRGSWPELGKAIYLTLTWLFTNFSLLFKTFPRDYRYLKLGRETMNSYKNKEAR